MANEVVLNTNPHKEGDKARNRILRDGQVFKLDVSNVAFKFTAEVMEAVKVLQAYSVDHVGYEWCDNYKDKSFYWKEKGQLKLTTENVPTGALEDDAVIHYSKEAALVELKEKKLKAA